MASMNQVQLQDLVASMVDDLNFGYFTKIQVNRFLNKAAKEVQKMLVNSGELYFSMQVTRDTLLNQEDYVLPPAFFKVEKVEVGQGVGTVNEAVYTLNHISEAQKDLFATYGQPQAFHLMGNKIYFCPIPDSIRTIRMTYTFNIPPQPIDGPAFNIPDEYHETIALFAAIDCLIKDGREANLLMAEKTEFVNRLKQSAVDRKRDKPRMVTTTSSESYGMNF